MEDARITELYFDRTEGIAAGLQIDTEGIFMPKAVGDSFWEENGAVFYHNDVSDYMMPDGMRRMFYMKGGRLVYLSAAYPSATAVYNLDHIEAYVIKMIEKTN